MEESPGCAHLRARDERLGRDVAVKILRGPMTEIATVMDVPQEITVAMRKMAEKNMRLDCTVQDGEIWLASGGQTLHFRTRPLLQPG